MNELTPTSKNSGLSRIQTNLFSNGVATVIPALSTFALTPILLNQLGEQSYGIYIAAMSLVGALALLDLGMTSAATKYVAQVDVQKDKQRLNAIISNNFSLYLLIGLVVSIIIYIGAPVIGSLLFGNTEIPTEQIVGIVRLIGWIFSLNLLRGAMSGVIRGFQRYDAVAITQTLYYALLFILQVAVVLLGGDVSELLLVNLVAAAILLLVNVYIVKKYLVHNLKLFTLPDRQIIRELFGFGMFLLVANLGGMLLTSVDKLIIINLLGAATLTYYAVPIQLFTYVHRFGNVFASILFPLTSELQSAQDTQNMRRLYLRSTRLIVVLTTIPTVSLSVFSKEVLSIWVNPELAVISAPIMQVASIGYLFQYIAIVPYYFLLGTGNVRQVATSLIAISVVTLSLLYVGIENFGLIGGVLGISLGLALMLIFPVVVQRSMQIPIREALKQGYGFTLIYSQLCILILVVAEPVLLVRVIIIFTYMVAIIFLGNIQNEDRSFVIDAFQSGWGKIKQLSFR